MYLVILSALLQSNKDSFSRFSIEDKPISLRLQNLQGHCKKNTIINLPQNS